MDDRKERNEWLSVPQFGAWDQKGEMPPDYSMDFSKIREMRKQNKKDISRTSIGNEQDLLAHHGHHHHQVHDHHHGHPNVSPTRRKKILSYFNCCIKA